VSATGEVLVLLVMLLGLVGVVVPVLPGLLLVWAAAVTWAWLDGAGAARWTVAGLLTVLLVTATVLNYVLPARSVSGAGAPRSTLLIATVGAVLGFFLVPVVGLVVGGVVAVFLAETARLRAVAPAWRSTRAVLVAVGLGVLVQLAAGTLMVAVWVLGVLVTAA
jgi:uncharacterized protein YqgC (DUF456 family)